MDIPVIASFIIFFLFIFVVVKISEPRGGSGEPVKEQADENGEETSDEASALDEHFDDEYFERCRKGEGRQLFCNFASWQDCSIFQGILFANGIPSHKEHENSNRFYFGSNALSNAFAVQLWILINDYNDAYELLRHFTKQKTEAINENAESESNNVGNKLLGIVLSPVTVSKEQEILGIKVFPKSEREI
ncbi:hypothetical protein [Treponema sp.]|uniref:hypothetical protein n=1 Tax=Treponema sp. TaxID=166 RepID=UPI00388FFE62